MLITTYSSLIIFFIILSYGEVAYKEKKFDSTPQLNQHQRQKIFALNDKVEDWLYVIRKPVNKAEFLLQLGYFRASGNTFSLSVVI